MTFVYLSPFDLLLASSFVLGAGSLSLGLKLGLERRLFLAGGRTVVQLCLLGLVLKWIFAQKSPLPVLLILSFMILVAGREAVARVKTRYLWILLDTTFTMAVTGLFIGLLVTQVIVGVKPWYHPQYVIPLIGMILGNSLNGVSLALDHFLDYLARRQNELELRLTFAATRMEILREPLRAAVKRGLIPIINAMSVAGIVSLPGMMTGQILAGAPPMQAVAYQILIMFMLAGAYTLGAILVSLLAGRRLIRPEGRLALERLKETKTKK